MPIGAAAMAPLEAMPLAWTPRAENRQRVLAPARECP